MGDKFKYTAGLHNVGSYRVAGRPYITGSSVAASSSLKVSFPQVTKQIQVKKTNAGGELRVHFGSLDNDALAAKGTMDFRTADNAFSIPDGGATSFAFWISGSDGIDTFNTNENFIALQNEAGDNVIEFRPKSKSGTNGRFQVTSTDTAGGAYHSFSRASTDIFANGWNHFILAFNGGVNGAIKIYHNGNTTPLVNTQGQTANPLTGSTKFVLFNGIDFDKVVGVDEVAVWGAELTGDDVTALYNSGRKADPRTIQSANLKLWYQFGDNKNDVIDGANTVIRDSSGNNDDLNDLTNFGGSDELFRVFGPFHATNNVYRNFHFWPLASSGDTVTLPVKCKDVFISSVTTDQDFQLVSSLTEIPAARMYELSGSGVDE